MPPVQTHEPHPCAWCGEPATERAEIAPAIFTSVGGVRRIKTRATEVDVCAAHAAMVARNKAEREAEAEAKRRERQAAQRAAKKQRAS